MAEMPRFDRKMSDSEGLMWRLEKDPHLSSAFAAVTILDKPPNFDQLMRRMDRAVHVVERLGQRVQPVPVNLSAPMWVDDPNFDLRYHVRHIALPKPGTIRQLLDLASLIACDAFDRTRPLWQFVVVDGIRGGKSALIEKLHLAGYGRDDFIFIQVLVEGRHRDRVQAPLAPEFVEPAPALQGCL